MRSSAIACIVAVVVGAAAPTQAQAQSDLRWRYRAGDGWTYRVSQERRMAVEQVGASLFGPRSARSSELQTWTLDATVRSVDSAGAATVEWTITRIQVSTDGDAGTFDWDSDSPEPPPGGGAQRASVTLLQPLVGHSVRGVVTARGELSRLEGIDVLAAAVVEGMQPELASAFEVELRSMFEGEAARQLLLGGLGPLPEGSIAAGEAWTTSTQVDVPLPTTEPWPRLRETRNVWSRTDSASGDPIAVIEVEGSAEANLGDREDPLFGPSIARVTKTGTAEFSLARGLLVRSAAETEIVFARNLPPPFLRMSVVIHQSTRFGLLGPIGSPTQPIAILTEIPVGSPVTETLTHAGGVTEWRLGNGVRVLLKPDRFAEDRIVVLGVASGGTSLAAADEVASARAAVSVIGESGLGDLTPLGLRQALARRGVSFQPQLSEFGEGIRGMVPPAELETLLQTMYLSLTSPRADAFLFETWRRDRAGELTSRAQTTAATFGNAWARLTGRDHPWAGRWTQALVAEADLEGALGFYRDRFADAGDMVFNLVGPFDPAEIRPLVERYLGGLPAMGRPETWRDHGWRLPSGAIEETVPTPVDDGTNTRILFHGPLDYGSLEARARVAVLGAALEVRLGRALRAALGDGRYVSVRTTTSDQPYERYEVEVTFASEAEATDEAVRVVFALVAAFKDAGPTSEEAERVRSALHAAHERNLGSDTYWSNELWRAGIREEAPAGWILGTGPLIEAVDAVMIRDAARSYLDEGRYVRLTLAPEPGAAGDAGAGPWLSPPEMQRRSNLETEGGFYPTKIEGRATASGLEYRASFAAFPTRFQFRSNWGMSEDAFEAREAELTAQAFARVWRHELTDSDGTTRVQSVWTRRVPPPG